MSELSAEKNREEKATGIKSSIKEYLFILPVFLLALCLVYRNLIINPWRYMAAVPYEDNIIQFWIWREWFTGKVMDIFLNARPFSLRDFIYYGILGNSTIQETGNVLDIMLLSLPLRRIFSFPASYNIKFIIIMIFNCYCAYFAVKKTTGSRPAACTAGVFMAANPFIIMVLMKGRMRLTILGFMVLYICYLYETALRPGWKNAAKAGVLMGLTAIFYWFYGIFLFICTLVMLGGRLVIDLKNRQPKKSWQFFLCLVFAGAISLLIALPWLLPYAEMFRVMPNYSDTSFVRDFPPLSEVLSPPPGRDPGYPWQVLHYIITESLPLGYYMPIFFSLTALAAFMKKSRFPVFLATVFVLFTLFSFGPYLRKPPGRDTSIFAPPEFYLVQDKPVSMPYKALFKYAPFLSRMQHPDHFMAAVSIALLFLGGIGTSRLLETINNQDKNKIRLITVAIIAAVIFETALYQGKMKLTISKAVIPSVYYTLKNQPEGKIIEVPLLSPIKGTDYLPDHYDTFQSITGRDYYNSRYINIMKASHAFRHRPDIPELQNHLAPGNRLIKLLEGSPGGELKHIDETDIGEMKELGFNFIVVHQADFLKTCRSMGIKEEKARENYTRLKKYLDESEYLGKIEQSWEYEYFFIDPRTCPDEKIKYEISLYRIE